MYYLSNTYLYYIFYIVNYILINQLGRKKYVTKQIEHLKKNT